MPNRTRNNTNQQHAERDISHRAYNSIKPCANKLLTKRWDDKMHAVHRAKVQQAKGHIDNNPPQTYLHLHLKLKKLQMEEERLSTIERDNRILLEKMSSIMRQKPSINVLNKKKGAKSLNATRRQRELLRITHENQAILRRLKAKAPHYNHQQWSAEWSVNEDYLRNISCFPYRTWTPKRNLDSQPPWCDSTHVNRAETDLTYRRKTVHDQRRPNRVPGLRKSDDPRPKTTAPNGGLSYPMDEQDPFPAGPDGGGEEGQQEEAQEEPAGAEEAAGEEDAAAE
eukprot:Nk52_evm30s156 gene=Nk52_evmTU30s156